MASDKKIDFLIKQGFNRDVINLFISYGVDKNLLWFLGAHKKDMISNFKEEEIRLVNKFKESSKNQNDFTYPEVLKLATLDKLNTERKNNNILHTFDSGYYVSIINAEDLKEEASVMSNCVYTHYHARVKNGLVGILALKQPSGKTIAHIEINKNGLIGQNFAKANKPMSKDEWLMVYEFFKNNSKQVDLSRLFHETYVAESHGGYIDEIILTIPTSVDITLINGAKETTQRDGFDAKRFSLFHKRNNCTLKLSKKEDVLDWIEKKRQDVNKFYDDLTSQILETSASNLYLSDHIKEKIFGTKKDAFLMKGQDYNLSEIDPRYGSNCNEMPAEEYVEMEAIVDQVEERADRAELRNYPVAQDVQPARAERLAVIEVAPEDDMAIAVDEDGNEFEVNMNEVQVMEDDAENEPLMGGIIGEERGYIIEEPREEAGHQPEPFLELLRRAERL